MSVRYPAPILKLTNPINGAKNKSPNIWANIEKSKLCSFFRACFAATELIDMANAENNAKMYPIII